MPHEDQQLLPPPKRIPIREVLRGTSWPSRTLLILALLLPLLLATWIGWQEREHVLEDARQDATRSVVALEEHAANVLDTHSLILRELDSLTRGRTGDDIAADERLARSVAELTRDFKQVSVIGIADADGRLRLNSMGRPLNDMLVADRDYFLAHKQGEAGRIFIGQPFTGRLSGVRQFAISMARTTPSGAFDGVIYTAVPLDYFISFWRQFTPSGGHLVPLMRSDGVLIARYPALNNPERLSPDGPFMSNVRRSPRGLYTAVSQVDQVERINAYSQVKGYPLFVSFSVESRLALEKWQDLLVSAAGLSVAAAAMLVALWLVVVRQAHQQRVVAARWRDVAAHLEREVARREQAEEAMRQGRKMEAVGQLAGGIAHDFNNLLAAIAGNLDLMRMRLKQGRAEELLRYVSAAESVVGKASAMTQRLLAFSRRQTLDSRPTDVNDRIRSMQELIERTVGPSIRIHTSLAPGRCATLCDANQLDNGLLNLAINARDAMPGGGALTISTAQVSLEPEPATALGLAPGRYVTVAVTDTGSGMPAGVVRRAFDPFFTTKPIGQGTGLGLSMVYGFVTQSGGQVAIDSAPGAGTTVTIYLPVHEGEMAPADAGAAAAEAPRPAASTRILLVDDEASLREPLAELLTELGYDVTQAADGTAALQALNSREPFEMLVSDVGLPGHMNGRQLADAARAMRPELKVLFITGYAEKASSAASLLGTGMEILVKPFGLEEFARKVADLAAAVPGRAPDTGHGRAPSGFP